MIRSKSGDSEGAERVEVAGVGLGQRSVAGEAAAGGPKHPGRDVEAIEAAAGVAFGHEREVAPGPAGDLEHMAARRRVELGDQAVAPSRKKRRVAS